MVILCLKLNQLKGSKSNVIRRENYTFLLSAKFWLGGGGKLKKIWTLFW